jgi:hypothetical protein
MEQTDKFRAIIRKMIERELQEMTTTANVAGYLTPMAFRGNKKQGIDKQKHIATGTTGFKLTSRGEKDLNRPADKIENINENRYHTYKKDPTATPHQKIAKAISELNRNLQEVERVIKMNERLKLESGIASEQLWKRTQQGLLKLESRLLNLASRIREIRGQ